MTSCNFFFSSSFSSSSLFVFSSSSSLFVFSSSSSFCFVFSSYFVFYFSPFFFSSPSVFSFLFFSSSSSSFFWLYSPWWTLSSPKIVFHYSRSCYLRLQFLMSIFFTSSSPDSSHLNLGLPTRRLPFALRTVRFLQGSSSCILKRCPSHLNLPIFITLVV